MLNKKFICDDFDYASSDQRSQKPERGRRLKGPLSMVDNTINEELEEAD